VVGVHLQHEAQLLWCVRVRVCARGVEGMRGGGWAGGGTMLGAQ
jgi:hypothetical protein